MGILIDVRPLGVILACLLFAACGGDELEAPASAPMQAPARVIDRAQTELPPLPDKSRATVVEPSAGATTGAAADGGRAGRRGAADRRAQAHPGRLRRPLRLPARRAPATA